MTTRKNRNRARNQSLPAEATRGPRIPTIDGEAGPRADGDLVGPDSNKAGEFYEDWQRYFDLYNFAPVAYVRLDRNGVVEEINQAGCQLLGAPQGMLLRRPLIVFLERRSRADFIVHMRRCCSQDAVVETDLTFVARNRKIVPARVYSKRSQAANRAVYWTVLIDLTEQRRLDDARVAAEKDRVRAEDQEQLGRLTNEATHRFLNVLSHELRTPLTPALFAASRLLERDMPDKIRRLASIIKRNIESEARLIDDLLDVSRIERGSLSMNIEPVDLHEAIGQAVEACRPQIGSKPISLTVALNASRHFVRGDLGRLRQVFSNLVTNAIKFTDRGRIEVRTTNEVGGSVRITVVDTGVGLGVGDLEGLFRSFEQHRGQSSRGGLGLGLAICRGVVDSHQGRIWASSRGPGQGSVFEVELSTISAPATAPPPVPVTNADPGVRMRILVVEDDDETAAILEDLLEREGHHLDVVHTVREASARANRPWDVVISDLGLPDGSGFDVARRFAAAIPRPRLIALSGYGGEAEVSASRAAGFERHLVKPIDLDQLRSALHP
jgi:signal transduction histidine kinase/CheY-like chemotaxis protein